MTVLLLILATAAALAVAVYSVSLRIHPWVPCRACDGSGKTKDRIWKSATGTCAACGGRGKRPRFGIRILQRGRAREMSAVKGAHKSADKRGN
jgi:DnaJ-class molecular chaperone